VQAAFLLGEIAIDNPWAARHNLTSLGEQKAKVGRSLAISG
jgi:hypothetical protein